jgi:2-alkenal reductase
VLAFFGVRELRDPFGDGPEVDFSARATERAQQFDELSDRSAVASDYPFLAAPASPAADDEPVAVVAQVAPAVVTVVTLQGSGRSSEAEIGRGTGFLVSDDGYLISNSHVVAGGDRFQIILADGDVRDAKLIGADPVADISVLQIDGPISATVPLGDSDQLEPGEPVLAIGSPLGTFTNTVTQGIVSGLGRMIPGAANYANLIQHDAAINPGNSGGPLLNLAGEVIGVNTLGISQDQQGDPAQGIFFAIPSNTVREIAALLIRDGKVVYPYLGIGFEPITPLLVAQFDLPVDSGAIVGEVIPDSPADEAGIRVNDVVLAIDDRPIDAENALIDVLVSHAVGETVSVTVWRNGDEFDRDVTLIERPATS